MGLATPPSVSMLLAHEGALLRRQRRLKWLVGLSFAVVGFAGASLVLDSRSGSGSAEAASLPPSQPSFDVAAITKMPGMPRAAIGYRRGRPHPLVVMSIDGFPVEVHTAGAFLAMRGEAARSDLDLALASGFRNDLEQVGLYVAWRLGAGNKAARPGRSNHQSGRALDLVVRDGTTLRWLNENASRFGFRRTVRGEPWHWEYVDAPVARRVRHHHRRRHRRHAHGLRPRRGHSRHGR